MDIIFYVLGYYNCHKVDIWTYSNVFLEFIFDKKLHSESMKGFYLKVLFMCIALLVPIVLVIELYSNELFQFVFGDDG